MQNIIIVANSRSGHNYIRNVICSWFPNCVDYMNLENFFPKSALNPVGNLPTSIKSSSIKIVLVRDLLNWYASFHRLATGFMSKIPESEIQPKPKLENLRWLREKPPSNPANVNEKINPNIIWIPDDMAKEDFLKISNRHQASPEERIENGMLAWLKTADEFLGNTNYLPDFLKISYDEFFSSREYREKVCSDIGGKYSERKLNEVTWEGGYSSFDKDRFQNRAQQMSVLERYKSLSQEKWDMLSNNKELLEFYMNNFELDADKLEFARCLISK